MKSKKLMIALALFVLLSVNMACSFSASTAKIQDAKMARDEAGSEQTTAFAPEDTFYCNVDLANAPDDTKVKAVWTAVDVEGADANTALDESELTSGAGALHFKLSNNGPWPAGKYKVELFLNDKLDRTIDFAVK